MVGILDLRDSFISPPRAAGLGIPSMVVSTLPRFWCSMEDNVKDGHTSTLRVSCLPWLSWTIGDVHVWDSVAGKRNANLTGEEGQRLGVP